MAALTRGHVAGQSGLGSSAMMLPGRCRPWSREADVGCRFLAHRLTGKRASMRHHEAPQTEQANGRTRVGYHELGPPPRLQHGEASDGGSATERPAIVAEVLRLGKTRNPHQDVKERQMNITAQGTHVAAETDLNLPLFPEEHVGPTHASTAVRASATTGDLCVTPDPLVPGAGEREMDARGETSGASPSRPRTDSRRWLARSTRGADAHRRLFAAPAIPARAARGPGLSRPGRGGALTHVWRAAGGDHCAPAHAPWSAPRP